MLTFASGNPSLINRSISLTAMAIGQNLLSVVSCPILAAGHEARQPALVTRSQGVQGKWRFARQFQAASGCLSYNSGRNGGPFSLLQDARHMLRRDCDHIAALILAEPDGMG